MAEGGGAEKEDRVKCHQDTDYEVGIDLVFNLGSFSKRSQQYVTAANKLVNVSEQEDGKT